MEDKFENAVKLLETEKESEGVEIIRKLAEEGYAPAQVKLSDLYLDGIGVEENEELAFFWCSKAAEQGDLEGLCGVACCYELETGVEKDIDKAIEWYLKAAEKGSAEAYMRLAAIYSFGRDVEKDTEKAISLYYKAAELGDARAFQILADRYYYGNGGVEEDKEKAMELYEKYAEAGDGYDKYAVSQIYEKENQTERQIYWLRRAAQEGHPRSQLRIARRYCMGDGMEQDYVQAAYWYEQAGEKGWSDGSGAWATIYYEGQGVAQDYEKAFEIYWREYHCYIDDYVFDAHLKLYGIKTSYKEYREILEKEIKRRRDDFIHYMGKIAEEAEFVRAENIEVLKIIGNHYMEELQEGIDKEPMGSFESAYEYIYYWYYLAAKMGDVESQRKVGHYFAQGLGGERNFSQAEQWYYSAASEGDMEAQYCLANMYRNGLGVLPNETQATYWYEKAAEQGHELARECLNELQGE